MTRCALLLVSMLLCLGLLPRSARAQQDALARAEAAYQSIDFEATRTAVDQALRSGGLEGPRLARAYFLLAVSSAAAEQDDAARDAATRFFALDPESTAQRGLAPRLRGPFLEARGFWASQTVRLGITVNYDQTRGRVVVEVRDPLSMITAVVVHARTSGGAYGDTRKDVAPELGVDVAGAAGNPVEVWVEAVDQYGNRVVREGSAEQPRTLGTAAVAANPPGGGGGDTRPVGPPPDATASHWGLGVSGVAAVAGIALGVGGVAMRESNAGRWNDDRMCLVLDQTRGQQCASTQSAIQTGEILTGVGFGIGGAAAIATLVFALTMPGGETPPAPAVACGPGPGELGVSCAGAF